MKAQSPLLGFNNNVRHKGRVFHIQTEDSGIRHPHIITHLFADGGRILKSTKTSYTEHLGNERLAETVRAMMQEQHKAMFIALRDGQFDYLFEEGAGGPLSKAGSRPRLDALAPGTASAEPAPGPEVTALADPPPPRLPLAALVEAEALGASADVVPAAPPSLSAPAALAASVAFAAPATLAEPEAVAAEIEPAPPPVPMAPVVIPPPVVVPPPPAAEDDGGPSGKPSPLRAQPAPPAAKPPPPRPVRVPAHFAPTEPAQKAALQPEPTEAALASAARRRASRPTLDVDPGAIHGVASADASIDLDLDALERAAAEAQTPFFQQIQDLPPPPAAVLGSKRAATTGGYSVRTATSPLTASLGSALTGSGAGSTGGQRAPEGGGRVGHAGHVGPAALGAPSPGRYAPSRPASIFATTRPQEGASIFGEDLISEKSLDEVILSYLAEDLDGPGEKK